MIIKASQRGGAKQLGLHLLNAEENEHVELHEIKGFVSEDIVGAFREAEAVSKGTKCHQYLFSVSLSPPPEENVRVGVFEDAIRQIEEKNGLEGQPRVIVFHEKEGRRHAHAVWSRIDAETMTAKPMSFFKNKMREIARGLYLEHGWKMPRGFIDPKDRDPRNFSLAEWQQAKRVGKHARDFKEMIQEAWATSDSTVTFAHALKERGLYLARGDRRGHVAVTYEGEVISIPRAINKKAKDVKARLGDPKSLNSVADTRKYIAKEIAPRLNVHIKDAKRAAKQDLRALTNRRLAMVKTHKRERAALDMGQQSRFERETLARASRFRRGIAGLWDRMTGRHKAMQKKNEREIFWSLERDREQRQAIVQAQLSERQILQKEFVRMRKQHSADIQQLHSDLTNYRLMARGEEPRLKTAYDRLDEFKRDRGLLPQGPDKSLIDNGKATRPDRKSPKPRSRETNHMDREGPDLEL